MDMDSCLDYLTFYAYVCKSSDEANTYHARIQGEPKEPSEIFQHIHGALAQPGHCHWTLTLGGWDAFPFTLVYVCFEGCRPDEYIRSVLDLQIQREVERVMLSCADEDAQEPLWA